MAEELRIKLPAASVTKFHPKLPSGTISKKVHHAVPQLFAKTFLQHFFARSPLVFQHSHESLELDSAMRGGTLGVAGAVSFGTGLSRRCETDTRHRIQRGLRSWSSEANRMRDIEQRRVRVHGLTRGRGGAQSDTRWRAIFERPGPGTGAEMVNQLGINSYQLEQRPLGPPATLGRPSGDQLSINSGSTRRRPVRAQTGVG